MALKMGWFSVHQNFSFLVLTHLSVVITFKDALKIWGCQYSKKESLKLNGDKRCLFILQI